MNNSLLGGLLLLLVTVPMCMASQLWYVIIGVDSDSSDSISFQPSWYLSNFYPNNLKISAGDTILFSFQSIESFTVTFTQNTHEFVLDPNTRTFSQYAFPVGFENYNGSLIWDGKTNFSTGFANYRNGWVSIIFDSPGSYEIYDLDHPATSFNLTVLDPSIALDISPAQVFIQARQNLTLDKHKLAKATESLSILSGPYDLNYLNSTFGQFGSIGASTNPSGGKGEGEGGEGEGEGTGIAGSSQNITEAFFGLSCVSQTDQNLRSNGMNVPMNWTVYAGLYYGPANAYSARFYPSLLTIMQNDSVIFDTVFDYLTAHVIFLNNTGFEYPESTITIDPTTNITTPNPVYLSSTSGESGVFNGHGYLTSGVLFNPPDGFPGSKMNYTITFSEPGFYRVLDAAFLEIGMQMWIHVLPSNAPLCA